MGGLFAQLANAVLAIGSIGIARACGADAQTSVAIGTIVGTTTGNAVNGIVNLTTKRKSDNLFNIDDYYKMQR